MTDLPSEIQVWESYPKLHHTGTWSTERYPAEAVTYVRKEDAKAAQALVVERAAENKEQLDIWAQEILEGLAFADVLKITSYEDKIEAHDMVGRGLVEVIRSLANKDGLALVQALRAERDEMRAAVEGLIAVLDRNEKKGPIPDFEMMFCWLAAQNVRAAFRKIAPKGEAT